MAELVYLNGWIGSFEDAYISVNDRGYNFGDGVYEVVMAYDGVMFALDDHLKRLAASAAAVEMDLPWDLQQLKSIAEDVLVKSSIKRAMIYIQVTRGTAPRNHFFEPDIRPNLLVTVRYAPETDPAMYREGVKVITHPDFRWQMCHVKTISLQANIMAKNRARRAGVAEVVFVLPDGTVTECGSSNIFIYQDGVLKTHPANNKILAGVTRQYVLQVAGSLGLDIKEEPFNVSELFKANEVFYTNTVIEVMPVVNVDGHVIGNGKPGPVTTQLHQGFITLRESLK
ncbi:D-amino-acid transaminase [Desulfoscipio geothermicus]|uniref:D-alanine aminotransferase n=1 Tax=Desulfoscipio geothermicus DSM 3669 TaxID=1121426 RepID=A0A1I6EJ58_9FIRM|nr:D-amino-acid transaminase [Desulfoscipio geothermicus]SFR17779.1 D-alanine transaminase [Desulfoscipio geothermicus DSM 3669]